MKKQCAAFLALILVLACLTQAFAAPPSILEALTPESLNKQINAFIQEHEATTAGVSIAVIRGDETLYRTDYGYADIANQLTVDKDSVFEWGSVTKLLVWTSVMQLAEQGKLDLNAPVSTYLPDGFFKRLTYDDPITMMNLMHHDAGWEDTIFELFVKPQAATASLEDALQRSEPRQNRRPGHSVGYSNYGVALAGYIVERISGEPFYAYVNHHIFTPLGMEHTTLHPTLEDHQWVKKQRLLTKTYTTDLTPVDGLFAIPLYPAGMATGTMDDFILFCKALLPAEGAATPLFTNSETLQLMLSPTLYYGNSGLVRNSHGFWTLAFSQPMMGHGGNTAGFSAYMLIHPSSHTGFLVMANQAGESVYNSTLPTALFGSIEIPESNGTPVSQTLRGVYQSTRTVHNGCAKLYSMMMTLPLLDTTEDSLSTSIFGQDILTLRETAPNFFSMEENNLFSLEGFIYANTTPSGENTLQMPYMEFVQTSTAGGLFAYVTMLLFVLATLEFLLTLLVTFIAWIIRRIRKKRISRSAAYKTHLFLCASGLGIFVNIVWFVVNLLTYASRATLTIHLAINIAYIVIAAICTLFLMAKLRSETLTRSDRVRCICTAIATLIMIAYLLYWNLCWF